MRWRGVRRVRPASPADGLGLEVASVLEEEDGASVGSDGFEDELEDLGEEFVDVHDVADGLGGLVHDGEVSESDLEPFAGVFGGFEEEGAFSDGDAADDGGSVLGAGSG